MAADSDQEDEVVAFIDSATDIEKQNLKESSEPKRINNQHAVFLCMATFFLAMIGHELALEAASLEFPDLESLPYAVTLFQFGFCVLLPLIISKGKALETFPKSIQQTLPYVSLSILVFGATALATASLKWVSYPTKVVFKSAKLIPTMMVSVFVGNNKKYAALDYFAAILLCAGAAGYSFGNGNQQGNDALPGIILLTISVFCDALVPNLQQKLLEPTTNGNNTLSRAGGLSASALMVNVNAVGFSGLLVYMIFVGHLVESIQVSLTHPRLFVLLTCVGLGLSTAVFAYTRLIQASGSVAAVAVATLRKVATVILSYVLFPKPIIPIHMAAGLSVLSGILIHTYCHPKN
mmetsp:Transcript_13344/g.20709  ORF Transcript_13344/g.20709 Transcript_13344/m.20709 type:complete len:350 (-) Transcript_13344:71-1120(-)